MATTEQPVVFYHYNYSPYARRIQWYLTLRGIPYTECLQPPTMPRPDLSAHLKVHHRRIPVLAIGRDIYLDTRLILSKLEALSPTGAKPPLGGTTPEESAIQRLLSDKMIAGGVFMDGFKLIPKDLPLLKDPAFRKDRADFVGAKPQTEARGKPDPQAPAREHAEALASIGRVAAFLETTLLADGRTWIMNTPSPRLADIEAVWPLHWMTTLPGALPPSFKDEYPLTFAWVARFDAAVREARKSVKTTKVKGEEAAKTVTDAGWHEGDDTGTGKEVEEAGGLAKVEGLKHGVIVTLWPSDTGSSGKDEGKLVGFDEREAVIENEKGLRVHAPREGFVVRLAGGRSAPNL